MYKNLLFVDVETTGLDPINNDIVQLSALIVQNGRITDYINEYVRPSNINNCTVGALKILNIKNLNVFKEQKYISPKLIPEILNGTLRELQDDQKEPFILCGYNIHFDKDFLINLYKKNPQFKFYKHIDFQSLDILQLVQYYISLGLIDRSKLKNLKLETVCNHFGITIKKAHNSYDDIIATYRLYRKLNRFVLQNR